MQIQVKKEITILRRLSDREQPFQITKSKSKHIKVKFNVTNGQGESIPQRFMFAKSPKLGWIANHRKNVLRMCKENQVNIPKGFRK